MRLCHLRKSRSKTGTGSTRSASSGRPTRRASLPENPRYFNPSLYLEVDLHSLLLRRCYSNTFSLSVGTSQYMDLRFLLATCRKSPRMRLRWCTSASMILAFMSFTAAPRSELLTLAKVNKLCQSGNDPELRLQRCRLVYSGCTTDTAD